jgi:hypothetical protein
VNQEVQEKESPNISGNEPKIKELESKINFLIFKVSSMENKIAKEDTVEKHEKVKRRVTN